MTPEDVTKLRPGLYRIHRKFRPPMLGVVGKAEVPTICYLTNGEGKISICYGRSWEAVEWAEPILLAEDAHLLPAGEGWVFDVTAHRQKGPKEHEAFSLALSRRFPPRPDLPTVWASDNPVIKIGLGDVGANMTEFEKAWGDLTYGPTPYGIDYPGENVSPTRDTEITFVPGRGYERVVQEAAPAAEPTTHPRCSSCGVFVSEEYRRYHDRCLPCRGK